MQFLIARYEKDSDFTDHRRDISHVDVTALADALDVRPGNHLVDVYPVMPQHVAALRELTGLDFDLDTYDYFLEPEAD